MAQINVELIRGGALVLSLVGLIFLGLKNPTTLGSAAIGGLSTAVGAYFGLATPRKNDKPTEEDNTP